MGFDALLGNSQLKENLSAARRKGRMSHFYLLSGPRGSGKHTLADLIAAAMLCREPDGPCGVCKACRKALSHSHPDYITVDDPSKKTVPVDLIREARADIFVRPNEGEKKIYLFPRAQDMGIPGQNALLKVLEEPPGYGVFLLLADNPEKLLPTVRSRCVELKLRALPEELLRKTLSAEFPDAEPWRIAAAILRSGGYLGQARELLSGGGLSENAGRFAAAYAAGDVFALQQILTPMEKWKRDALIPQLQEWLELLEQALTVRAGLNAVTAEAAAIGAARQPRELMRCCMALKKAMEYAQGNVSCAAVCGWLSWELR
ncbi:MAG: DNA polymerase III subunit [Oscillospiraceae bacterium]|nr:DNA polymerase III subunit [Oscillospiraceae bacterium]